jgi:hypothetical protein
MRYLIPILVVAAVSMAVAHATPRIIGTGCSIAATNLVAGSSAADVDCKWPPNASLAIQCDVAVYVAAGETATASHVRLATGDPYVIKAGRMNEPITVLCVAAGACTCNLYTNP